MWRFTMKSFPNFLVLFYLLSFMYFAVASGTKNSNATKAKAGCLNTLKEVQLELSSTLPPFEEGITNNFDNISKALFPALKLPSLYIQVTLQFMNDSEEPQKFTWSMSCVFVSNVASLTAMSLFSLGTLHPQRRKSELLLTVRPLCKDAGTKNGFKDNDEVWRYALMLLQDIAINPKNTDPRLNTAQCVVLGHEGDDKQPIIYPVEWRNREYWITITSLLLAIAISGLGHRLVTDGDAKWGKQNIKTLKYSSLTFFILSLPLFISEIAVLRQAGYMACPPNIIHCIFYGIFAVAGIILSCLSKGKRLGKIIPFAMLPACYQMVHHLLWILCGGIVAEPSRAIPLFLCECFAVLVLVFGTYILCGLEISSKEEDVKNKLRMLLIISVFSFEVFVFAVVFSFSGSGHISTENVWQIIMVSMLLWLIKYSGLGRSSNEQATSTRLLDV